MYETISYDDICRLCISHSKSIDIFSSLPGPDLQQICYSDIIQILVQIKFSENDINELPKGICNECATKLIQFYNFKIQTEASQVELLKLLEENLSEEQQEAEIELQSDSILPELVDETQNEIFQLYQFDKHDPFDYEINNVNMIEDCTESISNQHEIEMSLVKEPESDKLMFSAQNLEEYSIISEEEMTNFNMDYLTKKTEEVEEDENEKLIYSENLKYDTTPKFTLIENTQQLPVDEQFLWQKKLSKWVTKLPRGKRKSNNNGKNEGKNIKEKAKKVFQCEICGRMFSSKASERSHQTVHTGEKKFECEICHKRFTRIYHVKDHLRIHQGIQPYKCDVCGKSFTKNSDLHRHKRIHSNIPMYTCLQCGKEFKWKASFDIHLKTHNGIKAFKCTKCNNAYSSGCTLKKHQIKFNHL